MLPAVITQNLHWTCSCVSLFRTRYLGLGAWQSTFLLSCEEVRKKHTHTGHRTHSLSSPASQSFNAQMVKESTSVISIPGLYVSLFLYPRLSCSNPLLAVPPLPSCFYTDPDPAGLPHQPASAPFHRINIQRSSVSVRLGSPNLGRITEGLVQVLGTAAPTSQRPLRGHPHLLHPAPSDDPSWECCSHGGEEQDTCEDGLWSRVTWALSHMATR